MDSIATIKARLLIKSLNPKYPLNISWFASQILGKPVKIIKVTDIDNEFCAAIRDKPDYEYVYILVNKNHSPQRQRFSIVHELAHVYLEHKGDLSFIEDREDPVLRKEADEFATESLMPNNRIIRLAECTQGPLQLVRNIKHYHDVSNEAACRRILELDIYRGAFALFEIPLNIFFLYKTQDFMLNTDLTRKIILKETQEVNKGKLTQRDIIVDGERMIFSIYRFYTGRFLIAYVKDNARQLHSVLPGHWFEENQFF